MNIVITALVLAVVIEALIEYGKSIYKGFAEGEAKTAITQLSAIVISIALCALAGLNLFNGDIIPIVFKLDAVGNVLTAIIISRGANYVSDIIKKISQIGTNGM